MTKVAEKANDTLLFELVFHKNIFQHFHAAKNQIKKDKVFIAFIKLFDTLMGRL